MAAAYTFVGLQYVLVGAHSFFMVSETPKIAFLWTPKTPKIGFLWSRKIQFLCSLCSLCSWYEHREHGEHYFFKYLFTAPNEMPNSFDISRWVRPCWLSSFALSIRAVLSFSVICFRCSRSVP